MKMVTCIIRPEKLEKVVDALNKQHVVGMTLTEVKGFGRQKGQADHSRGEEQGIRFVAKAKLDVVVHDEDVNKVMTTMADAAHTGNVGDGKVFVVDIPNALRIRTGEKGSSAL